MKLLNAVAKQRARRVAFAMGMQVRVNLIDFVALIQGKELQSPGTNFMDKTLKGESQLQGYLAHKKTLTPLGIP